MNPLTLLKSLGSPYGADMVYHMEELWLDPA